MTINEPYFTYHLINVFQIERNKNDLLDLLPFIPNVFHDFYIKTSALLKTNCK